MTFTSTLRITGAIAALIAGYAHVALYNDGYKDAPGNVGVQFLMNAAIALAIAIAFVAPIFTDRLPAWSATVTAVVALGWAAVSLLAFFMARTDTGWLGFNDQPGFNPSPEAQLSVFPEIVVVIVSTVLLSMRFAKRSA